VKSWPVRARHRPRQAGGDIETLVISESCTSRMAVGDIFVPVWLPLPRVPGRADDPIRGFDRFLDGEEKTPSGREAFLALGRATTTLTGSGVGRCPGGRGRLVVVRQFRGFVVLGTLAMTMQANREATRVRMDLAWFLLCGCLPPAQTVGPLGGYEATFSFACRKTGLPNSLWSVCLFFAFRRAPSASAGFFRSRSEIGANVRSVDLEPSLRLHRL